MWNRNSTLAAVLLTVALILTSCQSDKSVPGEGYVDVTGGKVWYRVVGDGPGTPLLVLHGGPGVPSYYLKPLAGLGKDRPVVFYDQLGCGHSTAPDDTSLWTIDRFVTAIGQVRAALGLKDVCLYGHSWGSMLVADYLLTKPDGVRACIMAGPALSAPRWIQDAQNLLSTLPDSVQQVIRDNEAAGTTDSPEYQNAMMQYYGMYLARKQPWSANIDSSFAQMNQAMYNYMEGPSEFTITGTVRNYDATPRLHEITTPTLFIVGEYDEAPPSTAAYYQSLMPNAQLDIIPNAGHLAMDDDSAKYVQSLATFLDNVDRTSSCMNHKTLSGFATILLAFTLLVAASVRADWIRVVDVPQQETTALFVENEQLYVASADEIYRRTSANEEFSLVGSPTPGNYIQSLLTIDGRLFAGTYVDGIFESSNGGVSWSARNTGLSGIGSKSIVCLARRGDSVYVGTPGSSIFVSSLTGTLSWQPFNDSLGWRVAWDVYSLYSWNSMLFTGSGQNAYIHRNLPDQSHWQGFAFNENVGTGLAMVGFGQHDDTLIGVAFNGIYTSADSGVTWTHFPAPFSAGFAGSVVTAGSRTLAMLCHQLLGTFVWERTGGTWTLFHHQPGLLVHDIVYFDHRLYAAAFDGLWQFPLDPTDVDPRDPELPSTFALSQNYPNPFNPATTIAYRLNQRSHVTLKVFNAIGQHVKTLVDTELPAGQHQVTWNGVDADGNSASSGVYFYRLVANQLSESRKMLLLK